MIKMQGFKVIRNSCVTGKAVWIYSGPTRESAGKAYMRACRAELERVRRWADFLAIRKDNINGLLNDCLLELPFNIELTTQQRQAVRQLQSIARQTKEGYSEFYKHIIEKRRQREQDREIRKKMRERGRTTTS